MYVAILAGGVGTRLWPRSRQALPKQFSDITGSGRSMIQETVDRVRDMVDECNIYVITGEPYAKLAAEQLPKIPQENIIAEPSGRNTGPAIGLACAYLRQKSPDGIVAFLHADQAIPREDAFQQALKRATAAAQVGYVTLLGVQPTHPHTGFGYIHRGKEVVDVASGDLPVYEVKRFLEKPDQSTAKAFLADGNYYWNGGMFICRVDRMMDEFARQQPEIRALMERIGDEIGKTDGGNWSTIWDQMPSISIDHGIMEGAEQVAVVPLDAGWNDVGSWDALDAVRSHDENQNCIAHGDVVSVDSSGNIVYSDKLVALIGLENIVVVDVGDTLLVGQKSQMQKVKNVVEELQNRGRDDLL